MRGASAIRLRLLVALVCSFGLGVLSAIAPTIADGQRERADPTTTSRQVLTGHVVLPGGAPARGAVVVTSAGGQAVSAVDGSFELAVDLPLEAEWVEVSAFVDARGSGTLVASTRLQPASLAPSTSLGRLVVAPSSSCQARWLPTFGPRTGTDYAVHAFAVFDDGGGPALYAAGSFSHAGAVAASHVAKWNGSGWSALGSGIDDQVRALAVFDDGSGPALYAGGGFSSAGGVAANSIARWNGSSWAALGSGTSPFIHALTVFDDGGGPALYAGGDFTSAGGVPANRIARWNGSSWAALGSGMNSSVISLTSFQGTSGPPVLCAGGFFTSAGGVAANHVARWNGSSWAALGSGTNGEVLALQTFNSGSGPALYAGGTFRTAGGSAANFVARWNGSSWSPLGSGVNLTVASLTVLDDGGGPALYAGGDFTSAGGAAASRVARWNGSQWSALGNGVISPPLSGAEVFALAAFDDGGGPALFAGGDFSGAGEVGATEIARWRGSAWSTLGKGIDGDVRAVEVFDDGDGPALYAAGDFRSAGGTALSRIGKWDGSHWSALGSGMSMGSGSGMPSVHALAVFDDGGGPALYAAGDFLRAGGVAASCIARWDGSSWSPLSSGLDNVVHALAVFDDGNGPALYAAGGFSVAGGASTTRIARWNGASWSSVGFPFGGFSQVFALAVFDDGGGPKLYAGGVDFSVARWNGSSWSTLGGGQNDAVLALAAFDDGHGPALYAGGSFTTAGGAAAHGIARWNGVSWSALGSGVGGSQPSVTGLAVVDLGDGAVLYAGGPFTIAGGVAAHGIARWDGASLAPALGGGGGFTDMAVHDDGGGLDLFAAGGIYPSGDAHLGKWGCVGWRERRR